MRQIGQGKYREQAINGFILAWSRSGDGAAEVCKTFIHRFDSDRRLQLLQQLSRIPILVQSSSVAENVDGSSARCFRRL